MGVSIKMGVFIKEGVFRSIANFIPPFLEVTLRPWPGFAAISKAITQSIPLYSGVVNTFL